MPNPFVRLPRKTSKDVDRPVALTPVPERVHGPVFPYRGMETHGVEPTDTWRDTEDYDGYTERTVDVYEEEPEGPEPIPVRIVQESREEIIRSRFTRTYAPGTARGVGAVQIIGNDYQKRTRKRVRIQNVSVDWVWLSNEQNTATDQHGWRLNGGDTFESLTHDPLFAIGTVAGDQLLEVYTEYSSGIGDG